MGMGIFTGKEGNNMRRIAVEVALKRGGVMDAFQRYWSNVNGQYDLTMMMDNET